VVSIVTREEAKGTKTIEKSALPTAPWLLVGQGLTWSRLLILECPGSRLPKYVYLFCQVEEEFDFDGWRADSTKHMPVSFWKALKVRVTA
jgi:hypothetical protein